jgi:hypothetical protein
MVNMVRALVKVCNDRERTRKPPVGGEHHYLTPIR